MLLACIIVDKVVILEICYDTRNNFNKYFTKQFAIF